MAKIIEFDLDNTLTNENDFDLNLPTGGYDKRTPNEKMVRLARFAVEKGWTVTINTGRKERHRQLTTAWLQAHNIPYHFLFMGKTLCTYRIDDANIRADDFEKILQTETS